MTQINYSLVSLLYLIVSDSKMSLPNVEIDWSSIGELENDELITFLNEAYTELRIGSQLAKSFVSVRVRRSYIYFVENSKN